MPVMPTSIVAGAALVLALAVHCELLARLRRVDSPSPPWWFGYARDGTNLSALLMAWGAYVAFGFASATAFLAAGLTTLTTYMLDWTVARGLRLKHARLALGLPLAAWVALVLLRPASIGRLLERLIAAVQPAASNG
jgi:uncharacterized protein (DUF58 family)